MLLLESIRTRFLGKLANCPYLGREPLRKVGRKTLDDHIEDLFLFANMQNHHCLHSNSVVMLFAVKRAVKRAVQA